MSATDPSPSPDRSPDFSPDRDGESALPGAVGTWKRAYALVIVALAANVALLWILGRVYR